LHFAVIQLQDPRACNDSHSVDHFTIVTDPGAFALAYGAISQAPGTILTDWNPAYCDDYIGKGGIGTFFKKMLNEGPTWYSMMADSLSVFPYGTAQNETKLLPYVCASGSAPKEQCV
jgi:hypothetical protein